MAKLFSHRACGRAYDAFSDSNCEQVGGKTRVTSKRPGKTFPFQLGGSQAVPAQMKTYLLLCIQRTPCWSPPNAQWRSQLLFVLRSEALPSPWQRNKGKQPCPVAAPATGLNGGWCQLHSYSSRRRRMLFIATELCVWVRPFVKPCPHSHPIRCLTILSTNNARGTSLRHEDGRTLQRLCNHSKIFCSAISSLL